MEPTGSSIDVEERSPSEASTTGLWLRVLGVLVAVVLLNVVWLILSLIDGSGGGRIDERLWPTHRHVWSETLLLLTDGFMGETLFTHTGATLGRVLASLAVAALVGGGLGWAMGSHERLRGLLAPFVGFMRMFTPAFVLPISINFLGIGGRNIVLSAGFITTWFVADGVSRAIASSSSGEQRTAELVRLARTALLISWLVVAFTEVIGSATGLGSAIWTARTFFRTGMMLSVTIWSTLVFLVIDYGISLLGRYPRSSG